MKNKNQLKIIIPIICIAIITFSFSIGKIPPSHADSGFDSSYDSGDSSSDYSSRDYSSSSSSYDSKSSYKPHPLESLVVGIVVLIILAWIAYSIYKLNADWEKKINQKYAEQKEKVLKDWNKIFPNISAENFLQERFKDYCTIQDAWMNFDYSTLRKYTTDELYNQYEMQLETLRRKNQQNCMSNYTYEKGYLEKCEETEEKYIITVFMGISLIDYIAKNKKVIRGDKKNKIYNPYYMTFIKSKKKMNKCPNCKTTLEGKRVCQNCGNIIPDTKDNWLLSKKGIIDYE